MTSPPRHYSITSGKSHATVAEVSGAKNASVLYPELNI